MKEEKGLEITKSEDQEMMERESTKHENAKQANRKQDGGIISRRKLLASLGIAGATFASMGLTNGTITRAFADAPDSRIKIKDLLKMNVIVSTTITLLRALNSPDINALYYITDPGQEGMFHYDATDTTAADNTGTILVSVSGARFKRIYDGIIQINWFGAKGDGTTDDTQAIIAADNVANGGLVLLTKTYKYSMSGHKLKSQFIGNGSLTNYTGVYAQSFSGTGNNDVLITGNYAGGFDITFIIEVGTSSGNNWRWSTDNGVTWIEDISYILPDDTFVTEPIHIQTTPQALGSSGLYVQWGSTSGHVVGDKWTLLTDQALKRLDINGLDLRGQPLFREGGTRSLGFGKNVLGTGKTIGTENIGFGVDVLSSNIRGFANVGVGAKTLELNVSGSYNCAIGAMAMYSNKSGGSNSAFGTYTMGDNETGSGNTAYGCDAMRYNKTGELNTAVGVQSMYHGVLGWQNTAVGANALRGGDGSLSNNKSFNYNCAFGEKSLFFGGDEFSTAMGHESLYKSLAGKNVGVGAKAGFLMNYGELNVFVGYEAGLGESRNQDADSTGSICLGAFTATTGDDGIAIGRGAVASAGQILLGGVHNQNGVFFYGNLNPQIDGTQNIGGPAARFDNVYATSGSVSTSDERVKTPIEPLSDREQAAALEIKKHIGKFKFLESVNKKGDKARWHFGVGAQTVKGIFEKHGLDGLEYGVLCYDEWDDEFDTIPAVKDDKGTELEPEKRIQRLQAGNRYGVRYDELAMFILAAI
ncbi:tail fiber domain-containing protein [Paenibacillus eucommiae]|uniref:Peptidase S74 domain-containing protein n=1 Tax=Paenibacillus eucommiae TaxID=1355755 RepID=A0ABS4ITX3_9BACL|nr:tail fiber domain-containing protein [Paenibacillus eucommiae]MBP1991032.1 hypothetical protein [Paenibacillus eucommiae]